MTTPDQPGEINVYQALNSAIESLGYVAPDGRNANQGFAFRSIDGVVGAVRPVILAAGITIIPSFQSLEQVDYTKSDGKVAHRAILEGSFRVVGPAGDGFAFTTIGEAMDTEGRASNKAMSAATKNAYLRLFQIGSGDDGDSHDAVPAATGVPTAAPPATHARIAPAPQATVGDRVASAAPSAPRPDTGELLTSGQGRNLYRLWHHVLHWDKDRWLQEIEVITGTYVSDDRQLTKSQASDLIRALKIRAGEPVDDGPPPAPAAPASAPPDYDDSMFSDEPF